MELSGITFPVIVAVVALAGLWWHVTLARKGIATVRDRVMAALWAALFVVAGARVMWLVAHPPAESTAPTTAAPPTLGK